MNLDYQRFAEHAAKLMTEMLSEETLLARAHILDNTSNLEINSMQGVSRDSMNAYFQQTLGGKEGFTLNEYVEMLQMMPVIKLSRPEAVSAASALHEMFIEGEIAGETVIELTYDLIQHLCRERFVQRRIALFIRDGKATSEQIDTLKKVAEKFIDFVSVRPIHQPPQAAVATGGGPSKLTSGHTSDTAKIKGQLLEITLTNERKEQESKKGVLILMILKSGQMSQMVTKVCRIW